MLVPAINYAKEIHEKLNDLKYLDRLFMFTRDASGITFNLFYGSENPVAYAIIDKDSELVGFFAYYIDWRHSNASKFWIISFKQNNIIGFDVMREFMRLIDELKLHSIEFRVIGGKPIERHYDKWAERFGMRKIILKDDIDDIFSDYHDDIIYEYFND